MWYHEPQPPDLSEFTDATPMEIEMATRFTRIKQEVSENSVSVFSVWLVIYNQSFQLSQLSQIGYSACDSEYAANWRCWMLAKALLKVKNVS